MAFYQTPPTLGNQYDSDALLKEYLERGAKKGRKG